MNAITGDYEPYLTPPTVAPAGASVEAAVVTAAHKVLTTYFTVPATVAMLDAARDADLATIPAGAAKTDGIAVGMAAVANGTSVSENARALALMQMSISDALVASFMNKYHYNLWRPETGIRNGAADGNRKTDGESSFATLIPTPCFPSYPSNHASGTNGGLEVLRRLFGAAGHDITISNNVPALGSLPATTITEHYTQLKEIADDVDDARVYGGIHWRYDQVAGNVLGRAVATEVVKNNLRPVHP